MSGNPEEHGMWLSILQWSLRQSDGTRASELKPLSDADKEFLRRAFEDLSKDEPKRIAEILKKFQLIVESRTTEIDEDALLDQLQELRDMVEQIDMAQIMVKYGGAQVLLSVMDEGADLFQSELKGLAASCIGTIAQNHPAVQEILLEKGVLQKLYQIAVRPGINGTFLSKIIYAMSGVIRGHRGLEELFMSQYASSLTTYLLDHYNGNLVVLKRYFFLVNALLLSDSATSTASAASTASSGSTSSAIEETVTALSTLVIGLVNPTYTRKEIFSGILIPKIFPYILSDDVDLRDVTVKLIAMLYGNNSSSYMESHKEALEAKIKEREAMVMPFDMTPEQDEYERKLLQALRSRLHG